MKFSEMPYARPDTETVKKQLTKLTERLKNAGTYEEAKAAFLEGIAPQGRREADLRGLGRDELPRQGRHSH